MKNSLRLLALLPVLSICACSSTYKVPMSRMAAPEAEGSNQLSLQGGIHEIHSVTITSSISTTPVATSAHPADPVTTAGISGTYGVFDRLDLGADINWGVTPILFAKYQLLGDTKRVSSPGNFSVSFLAGAGNESASNDTDPNLFSGGTSSLHRDESTLLLAGVLLGYRSSVHALWSVGSSILWQKIEGNQTLSSSSSPNPIPFSDHSRYTEVHGAGYFTFEENKAHSFFLNPSLQWGWTDSFGSRSYLTVVQIDAGIQF